MTTNPHAFIPHTDEITVLYLCCGHVVWLRGGYEDLAGWDQPPFCFWECPAVQRQVHDLGP